MSTKIIKAWINGAVQEVEVEDVVSPEQPLSVEDRLIELEDKPIITDGNLLVGNGTDEMEEMTPEEVLSHINGATVSTLTTAEYTALEEAEVTNANTLYMLTDAEEFLDVEVAISEDGLPSLVDTSPMKVVDAINNGIDVRLYAIIYAGETRYYHANGRGSNSFGDYIDFVHSNANEVDTITISSNEQNGAVGRLVSPLDDNDVMISPTIAEVGQTIVVKTIDETGRPTEWEAADNINVDGILFDKMAGMLYLTYKSQIVGKGTYLGGGSNNAVMTLEDTTGWAYKSIEQGSDCVMSFKWSSVDNGVNTGSGTIIVKVGGELRYSNTILQGERTLNLKDYISLGYNFVSVTVYDLYNNDQTITLAINVYDPDALKSAKLVERTLSGDYVNDRVVTAGDKAFDGCNEVALLNLPLVTSFGRRAFAGVKRLRLESLTNVAVSQFKQWDTNEIFELPRVETVGDFAFNNCASASKIILTSATSIGAVAFNYCRKLKTLVLGNQDEVCILTGTMAYGGLGDLSGGCYIYVPAALIDSYKEATNWSNYASQFRALEDYTVDGTVTGELDDTKI